MFHFCLVATQDLSLDQPSEFRQKLAKWRSGNPQLSWGTAGIHHSPSTYSKKLNGHMEKLQNSSSI